MTMSERGKEPKEEKKKKGNPIKVSRRAFLKGMGTSAVAATLTATSLPMPPKAEAALPSGVKEAVIQLNVNDRLYRVKVKSPCFTALSALPVMAKGALIADIIAILGSIDIVLGEIDR